MVRPLSALGFFALLTITMIGVRAGAVYTVQAGGIPTGLVVLGLLFGAGSLFSHYFED